MEELYSNGHFGNVIVNKETGRVIKWTRLKGCERMQFTFEYYGHRTDNVNEFYESTKSDLDRWSVLDHKNIVHLFSYSLNGFTFVSELEYCGLGDIEGYTHNFRLAWEDKLTIMLGCSQAVSYLHSKEESPIVHNNIKPSKVLLVRDQNGRLFPKLLGFYGRVKRNERLCMSPSMYLNHHEHGSTQNDVFCLGLLFRALLEYDLPPTEEISDSRSITDLMLEYYHAITIRQETWDEDEDTELGALIRDMLMVDQSDCNHDMMAVVVRKLVKMDKCVSFDTMIEQEPPQNPNIQDMSSSVRVDDKISLEKAARKRRSRLTRLFSYFCNSSATQDITADLWKKEEGKVDVFKIPVTETYRDEEHKIRHCYIGQPHGDNSNVERRALLLTGQTGDGKSTVLNSIINCIFNIQAEDEVQLQVTHKDGSETKHSSSQSQTDWITLYTVTPCEFNSIDFQLTLVDTPGFCDTRGISYDQTLTCNMKHLFNSGLFGGVNSVLFVVKADRHRLTPEQVYLIRNTLSLFGKDIRGNFDIMASFYSAGDVSVCETFISEEISFNRCFKFNSSRSYHNSLGKALWKLGIDGCRELVEHVAESDPVNLSLSEEVIVEREQIDGLLNKTLPLLQDIYEKKCSVSELESQLQASLSKYHENKNYMIDVQKYIEKKVPTKNKQLVMYCNHCKYACHEKCNQDRGEDFTICAAFNGKEQCEACPGRCHTSKHVRNDFIYKKSKIIVKEVDQQKKKLFEEAIRGVIKTEPKVNVARELYCEVEGSASHLVGDLQESAERLKSKLLWGKMPSVVKYIETLVQSEGPTAQLKGLINKENIMDRIVNAESCVSVEDLTGFLI